MKETIQLIDNEQIIWEGKPLRNLITYHTVVWSIAWIFVLAITIFGIIFLPIMIVASYYFANEAYKKRYYWVTNKRIVYKRGILGYKITSTPLNRVADVVLSRTWFENLFGFGSVHIETLAGQMSKGSSGAESSLMAVEDPSEVQAIILKAIRENSKNDL